MKKYLLGFFAIVLAVAFSAFTTVDSKRATRNFINNGTQYVELFATYSAAKCVTNHTEICSYTTTQPVSVVPSSFSYTQRNTYVSSGLISVLTNTNKIYVP